MKKKLIYSFKNNRVLDSRAVYYNQRRIDKIIDGLMQELEDGTATGESISVTDSANAPAKLLPSGNTYQNSYTGKNLCNGDKHLGYYYTSPTMSRTGTTWYALDPIEVIPGDTYVFSHALNTQLGWIRGWDDNGENYTSISSDQLLRSFTVPSGITHIGICVWKSDMSTEIDNETWVQLEKGSTATDYEPYVGGQPSPSLNYPQQIHVVKGHNEFKIANTDDTEFQTLEIDLPEGMEMCKISNYVSTFEKTDGKWYITPHFKTEIDNANNVTRVGCEGKEGHYYFRFGIFDDMEMINFNYKQYGYINYGKANAPGRSTHRGNIEGFNLGSKTITLYTEADSQLTLAEFKAKWNAKLANVPLVVYAKSSLTNIEITDQTLISQLDKMQKILSHFGGTTITTITAGDLKSILNLSYKKSNRLRDDNQDQEIENIKARLDLLEG